jgi:hypothetical protein
MGRLKVDPPLIVDTDAVAGEERRDLASFSSVSAE